MANTSIVSINDLTKAEILDLLDLASYFEKHTNSKILDGRVVSAGDRFFRSLGHIYLQGRDAERYYQDG